MSNTNATVNLLQVAHQTARIRDALKENRIIDAWQVLVALDEFLADEQKKHFNDTRK